MPKCYFNKVEIALERGCFPVNLLHIFRKPFLQNTSGWLLLQNLMHNSISLLSTSKNNKELIENYKK